LRESRRTEPLALALSPHCSYLSTGHQRSSRTNGIFQRKGKANFLPIIGHSPSAKTD
jgi:hypothetical protein